MRLVKTDDLFLSPASKFRPDGSSTSEHNCCIEVRAREGHTICIHVSPQNDVSNLCCFRSDILRDFKGLEFVMIMGSL